VGILSHKFPAGVALTSILKLAGKSKGKIVAFGMGVSLSVPMGCFIAYRILEKGQLQNSAGILLAVSAGTFLYIAACDLLPELHRSDTEKMKRLFAFLFGLLIAFVSGPLMGG
jgi:zinc transporter ZupT